MRVAIVGGGVAGALLALRTVLAPRAARGEQVHPRSPRRAGGPQGEQGARDSAADDRHAHRVLPGRADGGVVAPAREYAMRVAIVGGGVAGALLALRTARAPGGARVDLFTARSPRREDASGVSGGLVRGFETSTDACRTAAESLAEIRSSDTLLDWTGYRETGSLYVLSGGSGTDGPAEVVDAYLPGSAEVIGRDTVIRDFPFRTLPADAVAVVERYAGHISPHRLRTAALEEAVSLGVTVRPAPVDAVTRDPAVRTADGGTVRYDRVVVAAGAWTPHLLDRSGLPVAGLRTKQIQYSLCETPLSGLGSFVDECSGLYGRPYGDGTFLLGLPSDRWDVDPDTVAPDVPLERRVTECARRVFGVAVTAGRTVASCDCYHDPAGLVLRRVGPGLHTFTGGSGGAAKTVLSASRTAATALLA
ncbi:NAD(P)/FAD-dependent oxidoreductase [Streptomyces lushanensis]|uniref:NAD(P)/FAD-dependent oxidoreductase n=1 Tax=Streptomyces lushanensis TaxID=1434255 RepID=UPI001B804F87|nr:FAD-dependent oxidoreductase [Streptomyces lushanensis]